MTNCNQAFSRVVIDAQLADQGWSMQDQDASVMKTGCRTARGLIMCSATGMGAQWRSSRLSALVASGGLPIKDRAKGLEPS